MIAVADEVGVDRIAVMNLIPFVPDQKFKQLYYHRTLANRYFQQAREQAAQRNVEIDIPPDFEDGNLAVQSGCESGGDPLVQVHLGGQPVDRNDDLEIPTCHLPWQACSINELGQVRPCCTYWRAMGDLNRRSFEAIWNGRRYRRLRSNINRNSNPICYSCRRPRFDSDENISAFQLLPSLKQAIQSKLAALRQKRKIVYGGTVPGNYNPVLHN